MLLAIVAPASAQPLAPHQASVAVADQGAATREAILPQALAQVVDRLTGRAGWRDSVSTADLREWAPLLLEEYSYQSLTAEGATAPALYLRATFSAVGLQRRLASRGVAAWSGKRPSVLLWLAIETEGQRQITGEGLADAGTDSLMKTASRWGLPVQLPLMDLQDRNALSTSDLWGFFTESVQVASERYPTELLMMARAFRLAGRWQVQWQLRDRFRELHSGSVEERELPAGLARMIETVAGVLAERYAVVQGAQPSDQVLIEIKGLRSYEDYAACVALLSRLAPVRRVSPQWFSGDSLKVQIGVSGAPEQLAEYLTLRPALRLAVDEAQRDPAVWRTYRWGP